MSATPEDKPKPPLRIVNINVNKSIDAQTDFIQRLDPEEWDIVCIQEPGFDFRDTSRATLKWTAVYPKAHDPKTARTRAMILVNADLPKTNWKELPVNSVDVAAIQVTSENGKVRIFSTYNNQQNDASMNAIDTYTQERETAADREDGIHDVWIGDFNRHSPLWDSPNNGQLFTAEANRKAERLIQLAAKWQMEMALPAGIPTLEHTTSKNWTRPDNVWVSATAIECVIECDVMEDQRPICTDHLPFKLILSTTPMREDPEPRWDWRGTDWENLSKAVTEGAADFNTLNIRNKEDLDEEIDQLTRLLTKVRDEYVPKVKTTPYTRRWWSRELADMRKNVAKIAKLAYKQGKKGVRDHPDQTEHKRMRNIYRQERPLAGIPGERGPELNMERTPMHIGASL